MNAIQIIWMLSVVALMAGGQILFKLAAGHLSGSLGFNRGFLFSLATNGYLIAGLVTYAMTTVLWVLLLREVPLSRAYPFTALTLVLVPLAGIVLFGEAFSWSLAIGGALMVTGLIFVSRAF